MYRLLYVCLDGLGDDAVPALGDRTPLEAARTPFMDALASQGRTGTVVTVGPGIAPESDIAVFAILGYDPRGEHPGRGVVEAVGTGMDFRDYRKLSFRARRRMVIRYARVAGREAVPTLRLIALDESREPSFRVRLAAACETAGLPLDGISAAIRAGLLSFSFLDAAPYERWALRAGARRRLARR